MGEVQRLSKLLREKEESGAELERGVACLEGEVERMKEERAGMEKEVAVLQQKIAVCYITTVFEISLYLFIMIYVLSTHFPPLLAHFLSLI